MLWWGAASNGAFCRLVNRRVCCTCSGFFGFFAYPEQKYQRWGMSCSTFWGAWAFLLGSYIQLVEMLN